VRNLFAVALAVVGCGDNEKPDVCVLANAGFPHAIGSMSVVATLPPADAYGEMVVTSSHVYFHERHVSIPYDVLRRTQLSTGLTEEVAQLPVEPQLRTFLDLVAWNTSNTVTIASPTSTRTIEAPFTTSEIDTFDFDSHHVFMSASGAAQDVVAIPIDGSSPGSSWEQVGFDLYIDTAQSAIVVNCGGVWRASAAGSFDRVSDIDMCAVFVAGTSDVAVVDAYGPCGYGIFRVDLESGATTTLVPGGLHEQVDERLMQTDTDDLYYIDGTSTLVRVPLAGGDPTQVLGAARTFTLSETSIYAIIGDQLVRIAKTP